MEEKQTEKQVKKKIVMDSPRSRYMDMSPTELGRELELATNTVRNRVDRLRGVDFRIRNNGGYYLYNHECLPVLKAYIGKKEDRGGRTDREAFFQQIWDELEADPQQGYCRDYLCKQEPFRRYVLKKKLEDPIRQRLQCIRELSENLDVYPEEESVAPYRIWSAAEILRGLDRVIYELANLIPVKAKEKEKDTPQSVKALTETWCREMISARKGLVNDLEITYDDSASDNLSGLEQRLKKTLPPEAEKITQQLQAIFAKVDSQQASLTSMEDQGEAPLKQQIRDMLRFNMENYLRPIFNLKKVGSISLPEGCRLPPLVESLARETCQMLWAYSEPLEKEFTSMRLWSALQILGDAKLPASKDEQGEEQRETERLLSYLMEIEQEITVLWNVIREPFGMQPEQPWENLLLAAVKTAELARKELLWRKEEKDVTAYLLKLMTQPEERKVDVDTMMLAAAVTIECYWRRGIDVYAEYIAGRCREYQKSLNKT